MRNLPESIALIARELDEAPNAPTRRLLLVDCAGDSGSLERNPIMAGLRNESWSVTVLPVPSALSAARGVSVSRFDRLAAGIRFFRSLARAIQRHPIIFLQAGSEASLLGLALPVIVLSRFFGKKVLLRLTTADIELLLDRRERFVVPLLKQASEVIVGSRYLQKSLARSRVSATVLVSPVSLDGVSHRVIEQLQPRILMTAPLNVDNNPLCALRAFRLVKQKYPRAELIIAGNGPLRASIERGVKANRLFGVEFVAASSPAETARLYTECDLYLNSSSVDETPPGLARAFAAGLPVVVTDADGLLPMVRERVNALIAPVNDHVGLADRIIELIENPALTATLSRAGASEAQKYSWSRVRQDWVNTLTGLTPG
jgi:glycosyltransferase involved in cell wall biosynthesis